MNCDEVARQLYPYLDRELTEDNLLDVNEHIGHCEDCFALVRLELGLIKLVRRDCGSDEAPESLRARVKSIRES